MDTWIRTMCRGACKRQVIFWVVLLVIAGVAFAANSRYFANFFRGPYEISLAELEQVSNPDAVGHYYVRVTGSKAIDTGITRVEVRKRYGREVSRTTTASYYALVTGKRLLLVKSPTGEPTVVTGALRKIEPEVRSRLFESAEGRKIEHYFFSYYLDAGNFRFAGYVGLAIAALLLFLAGRFGLRAWGRYQNIAEHPVVKRAEAWGDPFTVAADAERESRGTPRFKRRKVILTDNFLIAGGLFTFNLFRLNDLLWAFKKVTQRRVNYIPAGKEYAAVMHFYGGQQELRGSEKQVDEALVYAAQRAPWAVLGFSDELQQLFTKKTAEFCAAVEARRQSAGKMSAAST